MLSKIIERSAGPSLAEAFPLELVNRDPGALHTSAEPDTLAMSRRIAQLERELADTESAAYARGRREAEAEAQQRFSATMQSTAEKLAQSVKQLAELRPRLCREAESDLLRLAIAIAQRVLHRELNIDPMALQALVKVCLDRLGRQDQLQVRVSPSLADAVHSTLTRLLSRSIDVKADANLPAGSLIFETSRGQLDASIGAQLDEIERGLIDRLENK